MKHNKLLIAALLAGAFAPAFGADANEPQVEKRVMIINDGPGDGAMHQEKRIVTLGGDGMQLAALGGMDEMRQIELMQPMMPRMAGKSIKNAPYSAEMVTEQVQNLADGNQITRRSSAMNYRDSAGRTRQEMRDMKGEVRHIAINDDNVSYMLDPQSKSATKIPSRFEINKLASDTAHAKIEQLRKDGKMTMVERHDNGDEVIIKRIERNDGDAKKRVEENVQIHIQHGKDGGDGDMGAMRMNLAPMIAGAFGDMKWAAKAVTKDLGSKDIEGVKAEGKLRSYEIPAGEVGNKNPITVSDETWYAPDLQITVYSKHSDPRSGERIYRLASLKREEPAAALFTVPADYKVKDVMSDIQLKMEKKVEKKEAEKKVEKK